MTTKTELIQKIKEWISYDNEITILQKKISEKKKEKEGGEGRFNRYNENE